MVEVKWHREPRVDDDVLEMRLKKKGWSDLSWHPGHLDREKNIRYKLYGKPPNYAGKYEDHKECFVKILIDPDNGWKETGEILVRNYLEGSLEELWRQT